MNWKHIQEKYPKAWVEFSKGSGWRVKDQWLERGKVSQDDDYEVFEDRDLYDHFDGLGIRITIQCRAYGYAGYYRTEESNGRTDADLHPTRREAESAGWERAFEIREEQLAQVSTKT